MYEDGIILEDGKCRDISWGGVFYFVSKCYNDRFEIEIKIPFKSIRYKKGANAWGINFLRWGVKDYEASYWSPVAQKDGLRVSDFGSLTMITPHSTGYYIEIYPEAFLRYDKDTVETNARPSVSVNLKMDVTPQMTLNTTMFPDFAQIESDPYTFNLTRYPIRLAERRPFFIEGRDIFRMANLGQKYFTPLEIYYSRRIGKPVANGYVPILCGITFINKEKYWNLGMLGALTNKIGAEPFRGFGVLRAKRGLLENSEMGLLFSSTMENAENYNYALGTDGVYRSGPLQLILQSAMSDKNRKRGWATAGGTLYKTKTMLAQGSFLAISDSFDVSDIGYVPWIGEKKGSFIAGPQRFFGTGIINKIFSGIGIILLKEPESSDWSQILNFAIDTEMHNQWGFWLNFEWGKKFEADINYLYKGLNLSIWSGYHRKYQTSFSFDYRYCYNYRQSWLAYQFLSQFLLAVYPTSPLSISLSLNYNIEWNPEGYIAAITPCLTPRIDYKITKDMGISIYSELVLEIEGNDFKEMEIYSNRFGFLFSYNFKPKSWLYIALNDYRTDQNSSLRLQNQVGAIKAKYLVYF